MVSMLVEFLQQQDAFKNGPEFNYGAFNNEKSCHTHLVIDDGIHFTMHDNGSMTLHVPVRAEGEHKVGGVDWCLRTCCM